MLICHCQDKDMKRFSRILFVADTGNDDSAAFGQAVTLANNNQAQMTVVGLVDAVDIRKVNAPDASRLLDAMVEERRDQLQTLVQNAPVTGPNIEIKVLVGNAFVEIIREVLRHRLDLVIKSVEKTANIGQRLFGGTDMKLMRKCPCPVWSIKSTQQHGYREILVGLDYDPDNPENDALNLQVLEMASSLALADFSELHIVHAWHLPYEAFLRGPRMGNTDAEVDLMVQKEENKRRHWLSDMVEKGCAAQGEEAGRYLEPQLHLVKGIARRVVPGCAKEIGAELVIMGTVGRTGIPGILMGNTAEAILDQIDCSVLAIKPAGFISPVTLEI
jgi:nucleotide-binding universal stress UspA family protein